MIYKSKTIWFHTGPPLSVYPMILLLMRIFLIPNTKTVRFFWMIFA